MKRAESCGGVKYVSDDSGAWQSCFCTDPSMTGSFQVGPLTAVGVVVSVNGGLSTDGARALAEVVARYSRTGVVAPPTRVATVRGLSSEKVRGPDSGIVYVGRAVKFGGVWYDAHPLGNPYRVKKTASAEAKSRCVADYKTWLLGNSDRVAEAKKLAGKVLGCWCGDWDGVGACPFACHAAIIADVADGRL